jgi:O-antigen ligase
MNDLASQAGTATQAIKTPRRVSINSRRNVQLWSLILAIAASSWAGWVVLFGFLPIYAVFLVPALIAAIFSGLKFVSKDEFTSNLIYLSFTALTFPGVFSAEDQGRALVGSLGWIANFALMFAAASAVRSVKDWQLMFCTFIFFQAVSLAFAIPQFFWGILFISPAAYESQVAGLEGMSYSFGKNYLPLVSLGLCTAFQRSVFQSGARRPVFRQMARMGLIVSLVAISISESRSTQVAVVLGSVVMVCRAGLLSAVPLRALFFGGCFLVLGLYLGAEKWSKVGSEQGIRGDGSFEYRLNSWEAGYRMGLDHWAVGVGMGNYRYHAADYLSESISGLQAAGLINAEGEIAVEVHNVFIGIAAMAGIPAFIIFLWFYLRIVRRTWRISNDMSLSIEVRSIAVTTSVYLIMYIVNLNMHNLFNDNVPWFFIGAFWGIHRSTRPSVGQRSYAS